MKINLNNSEEFTIKNLKKLIESEDDSRNTQFQITNDGFLFLSINIDNEKGIKLKFPINIAGDDYIGQKASNDNIWVNRVYNAIRENWLNPSENYLQEF